MWNTLQCKLSYIFSYFSTYPLLNIILNFNLFQKSKAGTEVGKIIEIRDEKIPRF